MFKALGISQSSLKIDVPEVAYFVTPSPDPENIPSEDLIIRGSVVLTLVKSKKIKALTVRVVAHQSICFPVDFVYESEKTSLAEVQIQTDKDERMYEKGEHVFHFTLVVSASCPVFERCQYGRVVHTIEAIARGEGTMSSDIEAYIPISIVGNPAPAGETSDLNVRVESFRPELGPYSIHTAAQHFTVGGLLHFDLLLASVPSTIEIMSVSATLFAHYTIRSVVRPTQPPQYASKRTQLFLFDVNNPPCTDTTMLARDAGGTETPHLCGRGLSSSPPIGSPLDEIPSTSGSSASTLTNGSSSSRSRTSTLAPVSSTSTRSSPSSGPPALPRTTSKERSMSRTPVPSVALSVIETGGSYQVTHLARLPNDDAIRPSTLEGTKTPITTKHELIMEVRFYQVEADGTRSALKVLRSENPVILSSCCCMVGSLLVPTYSEALEATPDAPPPSASSLSVSDMAKRWSRCDASCVCKASKAELVAQFRAGDSRLSAEYADMVTRETRGGITTVVSWDDLRGDKYEYTPMLGRMRG